MIIIHACLLYMLIYSFDGYSQEGKWWNLFHDTVLDTIIETGLKENKNLLATKSQVMQSKTRVDLSRAPLFPTVSVQGRWNTQSPVKQPMFPNNDEISNTGSATLNARYQLDVWGEEVQQLRATRFLHEASLREFQHVQLGTLIQMTTQYIEVLYTNIHYAILVKQRENALILLSLTRMRYDRGESNSLALLQQRQQVASLEAVIPAILMQQTVALERLSALCGMSTQYLQSIISSTLPKPLPIEVDSMCIDKRPDVQALTLRSKAAKMSYKKSFLTRIPTIELTGNIGTTYSDPGNSQWEDTWSLGAFLLLPLFSGFSTNNSIKEALLSYEASQLNLSQLKTDAKMTLQNALSERKAYVAQGIAFKKQLKASKAVYDESLRQFRNGLDAYTNVLSATNALQQSEIAGLQTQRNILIAHLHIVQAAGGHVTVETKETDSE